MNNAIYTILLLFFTLFITVRTEAQDTTGSFIFHGTVLGEDTGFVHLYYLNKTGNFIEDSVQLNKGNFSFAGLISEPTRAVFTGKIKSRSVDDSNYTEVFLEPFEMAVIANANDFKHVHITGSKTQAEYEKLNELKEPIRKEEELLSSAFINNRSALEKDKSNATLLARDDSIREEFKPFNERLNRIDYEFIAANPASYISAYLLFYSLRNLSPDSSKMFYDAFSELVKNSQHGKMINKEIERKQNGLPGMKAENFSFADINGEKLSLFSLKKNGYIILDFWASWCRPCRESAPHLLSLYNKYHLKGLKVIAVAIKDDKVAWKQAIKKDNTGIWHQVLDTGKAEKDIADLYGISGIPVKILIDKNGIIVGRYEGYDSKDNDGELEKKLAELIVNK